VIVSSVIGLLAERTHQVATRFQVSVEAELKSSVVNNFQQVRVEVESLAEGVDLSETLTRARFEELNADLFKKTLDPVRKVRARAPGGGGGGGGERHRHHQQPHAHN
jgi:molecular chaperone DnaK (HSP70)